MLVAQLYLSQTLVITVSSLGESFIVRWHNERLLWTNQHTKDTCFILPEIGGQPEAQPRAVYIIYLKYKEFAYFFYLIIYTINISISFLIYEIQLLHHFIGYRTYFVSCLCFRNALLVLQMENYCLHPMEIQHGLGNQMSENI